MLFVRWCILFLSFYVETDHDGILLKFFILLCISGMHTKHAVIWLIRYRCRISSFPTIWYQCSWLLLLSSNKLMRLFYLHEIETWWLLHLELAVISHCRAFHTNGRIFAAHDAEFATAKERLSSLSEDPGNQVKLQIYALFKQVSITIFLCIMVSFHWWFLHFLSKQATKGVNDTKKPGMMDFVGKAKWDAWSGLGNMSQVGAEVTTIL